jgi:hypothetical protein
MITARAVPVLLPAHHRRVARLPVTIRNDFADPLPPDWPAKHVRARVSGCPVRRAQCGVPHHHVLAGHRHVVNQADDETFERTRSSD